MVHYQDQFPSRGNQMLPPRGNCLSDAICIVSEETESVNYRQSYFFDQGIEFTCRKCGGCCTGESGTVRLTNTEIDSIAAFLGISPAKFCADFTFMHGNIRSLVEKNNGDCVFFQREKGCTIYAVRPVQCKTYPFWVTNLRSLRRWALACSACPGIGEGRHHSKEKILEVLQTPGIP